MYRCAPGALAAPLLQHEGNPGSFIRYPLVTQQDTQDICSYTKIEGNPSPRAQNTKSRHLNYKPRHLKYKSRLVFSETFLWWGSWVVLHKSTALYEIDMCGTDSLHIDDARCALPVSSLLFAICVTLSCCALWSLAVRGKIDMAILTIDSS